MKVINNEAVFPLQLEEDEYIATCPFNCNWQEFVVFKMSDDQLQQLTCTILCRDKLSYNDHRKELTELVKRATFHLVKIWSSYEMSGLTDKNQKVVFQLDIKEKDIDIMVRKKDIFRSNKMELKVNNRHPLSFYPRFNGITLYCKDRIL